MGSLVFLAGGHDASGGQRLILGRSSSASGGPPLSRVSATNASSARRGGMCETVGARRPAAAAGSVSGAARPASESSSALAGVNPRNACHLCCAQHAARVERRLRAQGRPQDVAEPLDQLLFGFCVICRYLKRYAFRSLTFGCDGARAAAPIANARTAFILALCVADAPTCRRQHQSLGAGAKSQFQHSGGSRPTRARRAALGEDSHPVFVFLNPVSGFRLRDPSSKSCAL